MSKILQITEKNLLLAYSKADQDGKQLLSNLFGKEIFSQKITDRIKSFEDACESLGIDPLLVIQERDTKDEIAYKKLKIIIKVLNEGWIPDWSDRSQPKYFCWFEYKSSGVGFSNDDYDYWLTPTHVGSRLCFKSSELAIYAAKQFEKEYNEFLNL